MKGDSMEYSRGKYKDINAIDNNSIRNKTTTVVQLILDKLIVSKGLLHELKKLNAKNFNMSESSSSVSVRQFSLSVSLVAVKECKMLCYVMLCYVMLCYVMLCYVM
jgi:hypothetical protein